MQVGGLSSHEQVTGHEDATRNRCRPGRVDRSRES